MNSITHNYAEPSRASASIRDRFNRVRRWFANAHARRPRQEYWQWLRAQIRENRENGF
jgi:hypothetical protein